MISDPTHPIWSIIERSIGVCLLIFFSWLNASNFDQTEYKMISEMIVAQFVVTGGVKAIKKRKSSGSTGSTETETDTEADAEG